MTPGPEGLGKALADRYRIERELGQGGMATVYLAADIKHDRKVAIKVLRPELAAVLGAERFVQEIKTTAALSHPHILPLFDSGEADGFLYYVMPYVEGETIREKLNRETQLGIDEAVRITTEVADALDYAHRNGVIHRDIKPENILLHDGRPMVMDFGIALAVSAAAGGRMTETGLSLGTPHYMSPEQATADKTITARSDIYSLASVLYEMLTGSPPHSGASAQQIIMKIIAEAEAPVTTLRKNVPPNVEAALGVALEKLPADRFESAKAFADALTNPGYRAAWAAAEAIPRGGRSRARGVVGAVIWMALGALVTLAGRWAWRSGSGEGGESRLQITYTGRARTPAVSPDGRFVAFLEDRCPEPLISGGCVELEVLEVGTTSPVEIMTGALTLAVPRWTHDGSAVAVAGVLGSGRAGLFLVPRLGGTPRRIADEPSAYDTHPTADSLVAVFDGGDGAELRVMATAEGGAPAATIRVPFQLREIDWSPDGKRFVAMRQDGQLSLLDRSGSVLSTKDVTATRGLFRWSADGSSLLTTRGGAGEEDDLIAIPVEADGALGDPRLLASHIRTLFEGSLDVARATGRLVVGTGTATTDIWELDLDGTAVRARRLTRGTNWYGPPILSGDGRTVYYLRADALGNNLYGFADGHETGLTADRQRVRNGVRLSLDERVLNFEARIEAEEAEMAVFYNLATGASRGIPREPRDMAWMVREGGAIVWLRADRGLAWVTDSAGGDRRQLAVPSIGTLERWNGGWLLAPDGQSIAVLGTRPEVFTLVRVSLDGGPGDTLASFPTTVAEAAIQGGANSDGPIGLGLAGWSWAGIYLARGGAEPSLLRLDPATRAVRTVALLPVGCAPRAVSVAADGRRAACVVTDSRRDLLLIDGLRP